MTFVSDGSLMGLWGKMEHLIGACNTEFVMCRACVTNASPRIIS